MHPPDLACVDEVLTEASPRPLTAAGSGTRSYFLLGIIGENAESSLQHSDKRMGSPKGDPKLFKKSDNANLQGTVRVTHPYSSISAFVLSVHKHY